MIDFRFVRKCVLKEETVNLSLMSISSLNLNNKDYQEDVRLCLSLLFRLFLRFDHAFLFLGLLQIDMIEDSDATTANHEQLTTQGREPGSIRNISIWDIARPFRVQIVGGENFSVGNVESLYVEMGL